MLYCYRAFFDPFGVRVSSDGRCNLGPWYNGLQMSDLIKSLPIFQNCLCCSTSQSIVKKMNKSNKVEIRTQEKIEAAKAIRRQLLALIDVAESNNLLFVAYILKMAADESLEIATGRLGPSAGQ